MPVTDDLNLNEAAELILNMNEPEEPETVETAPEVPEIPDAPQPEADYIAEARAIQPQLAAYQLELANEQAAIKEAERDAKALRKDDPAEYSARMSDILLRQQRLNQVAQQFQSYVNDIEQKVSEQHTKAHERKLASENAKLQRELGWNQEKKAELTSYLKGKGYSDQQLAGIVDAEAIKIAWNSMQADKAKKAKTLPKKAKKLDPRINAEREIQRRNLGSGTLQAATERIMALAEK